MKSGNKKKFSKTIKRIIIPVAVLVIVAVIAISSRVRAERAELAKNQSLETITLEKTNMTREVSVSGVVESARTTNIYTTQSFPVKEIYVKTGDAVKAGDVLAVLDMSKLENDMLQIEINLKSAIASAEEEIRTNSNSVVNAQNTLDSSRISLSRQRLNTKNAESDLKEAEEKASEEFDSYTYDNIIEDARILLERRMTDLEKAQEDLDEAIGNFDDYIYQNAINEAKINLSRREDDLATAEDALDFDKKNIPTVVYSYQTAADSARTQRDASLAKYKTAEEEFKEAQAHYNNLEPGDAEKDAAMEAVKSAEDRMKTLKNEYDETESALSRALTNLQIARENALGPTEKARDSAANLYYDAKRAYDKAVTDLDRAKRDAVDMATDKLTVAQNANSDAQRAYEKAMNDKIKAIENNEDGNKTRLENAQKAYEDSLKMLESSQNSVGSSQNTLDQAQSRPASQGANVEIQELNLKKLSDQLEEGQIIATADGVVTEVNVKVGSIPAGVIFVIEDTDNLHVSARVREYSISSVLLGQETIITTDATGDKEYAGVVSYISPKAVSAAGSTSVEFEVQASLDKPDTEIKIGMNAFLNIIIERKPNVYAVPNSAIVSNERGNFVYMFENGERFEIDVNLGITTMVNTEISGYRLYDGMELLIDPEGLLSKANSLELPTMWRR